VVTTLGLLIGMILGQRFKVLILFPAILLIVLLAAGTTIVGTKPLSSVALNAAMAILGLQVGYCLGIGIYYVKLGTRAHRLEQPSPGARI
jgi:hypothetical protein